eukprot:2490081-Rhodomonas_salina.1
MDLARVDAGFAAEYLTYLEEEIRVAELRGQADPSVKMICTARIRLLTRKCDRLRSLVSSGL